MRTDRYELAMLAAAHRDGLADRGAVFELFTRRLPVGRRFGILAGLGRFLEVLPEVRFDADDLAWLAGEANVGSAVVEACVAWRFGGHIEALPEGTPYQANEPLLRVRGTFADGVILETLLLSFLNADSAIAAAAARVRIAAGPTRGLAELGGRRVDPDVAVAAARATFIAGFDATSNLAAGQRFAIPTIGTMAHAWVLAHRTEREAFESWVATHGAASTFLIDTYDIEAGIDAAIDACRQVGAAPGGIRIDSGDLGAEALAARAQLDRAGCAATKIVVSGDLDDLAIVRLHAALIDTYGVGTQVVCGGGAPTCSMVYKLVAVEDPDGSWRRVAKQSAGKASVGGLKRLHRTTADGRVVGDALSISDPHAFNPADPTDLLVPMVRDGTALPGLTGPVGTLAARRTALAALAAMDEDARRLDPGEPAWAATPAAITTAQLMEV